MINRVHEIIKDSPKDDFWKEPDNEFLFDDIVSMCKNAGYDIFMVPTKTREREILTDYLENDTEEGAQMLRENGILPEAYKKVFTVFKKALTNEE